MTLLVINALFIGYYLSDIDFRFNAIWLAFLWAFFLTSIVVSSLFLYRSRIEEGFHPYLSITVLAISIGSFGWFLFLHYLFLLIG